MPDVAQQIEAALGPTPPAVGSLEDTLAAGRRAVRRRRLTYGVGAAAAALVVGGAAWVLAPDGTSGSREPGFVGDPPASSAPSRTPADTGNDDCGPGSSCGLPPDLRVPVAAELTPPGGPARPGWEVIELPGGELLVRPGWEVVDRIDDPAGVGSLAVAVAKDGRPQQWYLWDAGGSTEVSDLTAPTHRRTFAAWVTDTVPQLRGHLRGGGGAGGQQGDEWPGVPRSDLVRWSADATTLEALPGVELLEVRAPIDLGASFAPPDASAVAAVSVAGVRWYVAARHVDSVGDYVAVPGEEGGPSLDAFVTLARERYAEGGGGLL